MKKKHAITSDDWSAVDGLGRTLPSYEEVGEKRDGKFVGMFYWTWHDSFCHLAPQNIQKTLEQYPEAVNDYGHPVWGDSGKTQSFWNEPVYGYYSSKDRYVIRKQAELLADAGVDVVVFDCTNGDFIWEPAYEALLEGYEEARADGVAAPRISFLLNFGPCAETVSSLTRLYRNLYQPGRYRDHWFYWEGKPLIWGYPDSLDPSDPLQQEIREFFTFRPGNASYFTKEPDDPKKWGWLSVYPQTKYGEREDGSVEQMAVGISQNASRYGLVAMNDYRGGVYGRSHTQQPDYFYSYSYKDQTVRADASLPHSQRYGLNFQEQWDYALSVDPDFVFVTGWNEWIMGRFREWQNSPNAFPDQFCDEYSRDIEPSKGDLRDYYYYQLVANVRRFKGMTPPFAVDASKTIDVTGPAEQWDDVPAYPHYRNNTLRRDNDGFSGCHYENTTMRNDIVSAQATYDSDFLYFCVRTAQPLTAAEESPGWMRLFLRVGELHTDTQDWEGFTYVINRKTPECGMALLEKCAGGWNWEDVEWISYSVQGDCLQLRVPRRSVDGVAPDFVCYYKWSDNMQVDGDILDFYTNGDTAPGGRFVFCLRGKAE